MFPSSAADPRFQQELHRLTESGFAKMTVGMRHEAVAISAESRNSFHTAFGINPDEQVALENWFDQHTLSLDSPEVLSLNAEPVLPLNDLQGILQWKPRTKIIE